MLTEVPLNFRDVLSRTLAALTRSVTQEQHLDTLFSLLYCAPHNKAISGVGDDHAHITTKIPATAVGKPDGYFEYHSRLAGIVELKTFWNLTPNDVVGFRETGYSALEKKCAITTCS